MSATFHQLTSQEFASLGFWAIPMFSILFLAFLPVWVVGLTTLRNLKTQVLSLKYKIAQWKLLLLFIHRGIYVKLLFLWGFDFWDFVLIMILFRPILRYCLRYPGLYDPESSSSIPHVFVCTCIDHTSYLSREPRVYPCKFFLAGVNFYRFNAKNWHFRQILREKVAFFLQI